MDYLTISRASLEKVFRAICAAPIVPTDRAHSDRQWEAICILREALGLDAQQEQKRATRPAGEPKKLADLFLAIQRDEQGE